MTKNFFLSRLLSVHYFRLRMLIFPWFLRKRSQTIDAPSPDRGCIYVSVYSDVSFRHDRLSVPPTLSRDRRNKGRDDILLFSQISFELVSLFPESLTLPRQGRAREGPPTLPGPDALSVFSSVSLDENNQIEE